MAVCLRDNEYKFRSSEVRKIIVRKNKIMRMIDIKIKL